MKFNESEFELKTSEIDSGLAKKEVKVSARPFNAVVELLKSMNVSGPLTNPYTENLNFPVAGSNACAQLVLQYVW